MNRDVILHRSDQMRKDGSGRGGGRGRDVFICTPCSLSLDLAS